MDPLRDRLSELSFVETHSQRLGGGLSIRYLAVKWIDAGLAAMAIIAVAFFDSVADIVAELWQAFVIDPVDAYAGGLGSIASSLASVPRLSMDWSDATQFASDTGFIGAVLLTAVGGYIIAVTWRAISDG